jgi:hypothetical protein
MRLKYRIKKFFTKRNIIKILDAIVKILTETLFFVIAVAFINFMIFVVVKLLVFLLGA